MDFSADRVTETADFERKSAIDVHGPSLTSPQGVCPALAPEKLSVAVGRLWLADPLTPVPVEAAASSTYRIG